MNLNNLISLAAVFWNSMNICCSAATGMRCRVLGMLLGLWLAERPCHAGVDAVSGPALQKVVQQERSWFKPQMTLTGEAWGNVDGGVETGAGWNCLVDLSADVDLHQACGFAEGSSLALQVLGIGNRSGESVADRIGSFNPVSGMMAGNAIRCYNLHFRQALDDDRLVVKLGQMAADDDFMVSDFSGLFMNSSFGAMPSQFGTPLACGQGDSGAFPGFAVASPGAFVSYAPSDRMSAQAGVYVGCPGVDRSSNHGFDWQTGGDAGIAMFYESAWHHRLAGLSGALKLGGTLHSGCFHDYGASAGGYPDGTVRGIHSFYLMVDQAVIENGKGEPSLGLFCRCGWSPLEDRSAVSVYHDLGLVWNRPFGCENHSLGMAVACTRFGAAYQGFSASTACETNLEITYRAPLAGRLSVQGAVQYLLDPAFSRASGGDDSALLAGLRTELSF